MKFNLKNLAVTAMLSTAPIAHAAPTYILFGDSIMSEVYPSTLNGPNGKAIELTATRVSLQADVIIRNLSSPGNSLGGSTFSFKNASSLMGQIGGAFSYYNGTIVQALTNDFGRSIPIVETTQALDSILKTSARLKRPVIMMDAIWRRNETIPNKLGLVLEDYRDAVRTKCAAYPGVCFFISRKGTPFDSAAGYKLYNANEVENGKELHLNAEGHRRYADWLMQNTAKRRLF